MQLGRTAAPSVLRTRSGSGSRFAAFVLFDFSGFCCGRQTCRYSPLALYFSFDDIFVLQIAFPEHFVISQVFRGFVPFPRMLEKTLRLSCIARVCRSDPGASVTLSPEHIRLFRWLRYDLFSFLRPFSDNRYKKLSTHISDRLSLPK